ncbi:tetratricopeptide repeat protein [Nitrosomonas sp. Nm84]|uniref:tetratricopeptide repeat protein n=1 Tax=Nitrosomonas sp. Nm84 TaxID=200124 RepID=UPI000D751919|nr:tetratricopeptide repeat protein [Nitrosomonas sp. Nm84]PXW89126.1 tetratricopeptide repeat protein [Nitrosomonas sp. Nm84]
MKITKNILYIFWGIFFSGLFITHFAEHTKDLFNDSIVFSFTLFFITLFALFSKDHLKNLTQKELENEYRLIKETSHLTPADFQFRETQPGEKLNNSDRPYFITYINRKAIPYDTISENNAFYDEQDLAYLLEQDSSILLIGNPTEGKTRTLFEVTRKLNDFLVIQLLTNKSPSDEALRLLEGRKVLWLFDDLSDYNSNTHDLNNLFSRLKQITKQCVLAATCRNGPELKDAISNTGQLHNFYQLFDHKLTLKPAGKDQKEELKRAIGETETREFPTLGSICMHKHFEFMHIRFAFHMNDLEKNCLRSIILLYAAFIKPLTHQRIRTVLKDIFDHNEENIDIAKTRACLNTLVNNGFIKSPRDVDPIIPEAAYINKPESEFYYPEGRSLQTDMERLAESLTKHSDIVGLNQLAYALRFYNNMNSAVMLWEEIANNFLDSQELVMQEQVIIALFNKGTTLFELNRINEAIECYDYLVKLFGDKKGSVFQEYVAKALSNKGLFLRNLMQIDEAIKCYDTVIQRYAYAQYPFSEILIVITYINKGSAFALSHEFQLAIDCYDEVINRFINTNSFLLQEQIAIALNNKGLALVNKCRFREAIDCYEDVVQYQNNTQKIGMQVQITEALIGKGKAFEELDETGNAIKCYAKLVEHFEDNKEPDLQEQVATALNALARIFFHKKEYQKGFDFINDVCQYITKNKHIPGYKKHFSLALYNSGITFIQLNEFDQALGIFNKVLKYLGNTKEPSLQEYVAKIHIEKGYIFHQQDLPKKAIKFYNMIIRNFKDSREEDLQESVAKALVNKGNAYLSLKQTKTAIRFYNKVLQRFQSNPAFSLQIQVANALFNRGNVLCQQNKIKEGINCYDQIMEEYASAQHTNLQEIVAKALYNKGYFLCQIGERFSALNTLNYILDHFNHQLSTQVLTKIVNDTHNLIRYLINTKN